MTIAKRGTAPRSMDLRDLVALYDIMGRPKDMSFVEDYRKRAETEDNKLPGEDRPEVLYEMANGVLKSRYQNASPEERKDILDRLNNLS